MLKNLQEKLKESVELEEVIAKDFNDVADDAVSMSLNDLIKKYYKCYLLKKSREFITE